MSNPTIIETPWDKKIFGINTFEVLDYSEETLSKTTNTGLYTLKLDPLADKTLAQKFDFYYCDTLIVPECKSEKLQVFKDERFTSDLETDIKDILPICNGAFSHGRFHRDFNLSKKSADERYNQWLLDIHAKGNVFGLRYEKQLAGFIATHRNELQLHAVHESYRGKGYAKFWWTQVCQYVYSQGYESIKSSVSASNLAVVNLYSRLGFEFNKSVDVYHKYES
ncbi:MAG: GNAT family N-acetyltransferase [Methylophilus methylotrophus]|uniref:GNAT family N-acetyltransferase n=1 Tax=Methylophilus methylotrophus TaxID=17 RepID=A0A5C7WP95_METME|nr:MAG: GNAT family N-acetyltransferase [Methylophilus methylotrophus]